MANIKYGNEALLMFQYSHAAILIDIPSRWERRALPALAATFPAYRGVN